MTLHGYPELRDSFMPARKSQGDCQQFSSDWQVPLRQEEAFMDSVFGCKDMEGSRKEKAMQAANVLAREMGVAQVSHRHH